MSLLLAVKLKTLSMKVLRDQHFQDLLQEENAIFSKCLKQSQRNKIVGSYTFFVY